MFPFIHMANLLFINHQKGLSVFRVKYPDYVHKERIIIAAAGSGLCTRQWGS